MKNLWPAMVLIVGCQSSSARTNVDNLGSDPKDRESYSLGYQLGTQFKKQETSIELDAYVAGLRDGLAGKPARVNQKELETAVAMLREKAVTAQQKSQREQAEKNRAAGNAFLEANKKREGVKTLPSGLQYRILDEGKGASAGPVGSVTVNYRSSFVDGKELSISSKPMTVDLQHVIPAWREAIPMMKEGAKWELVVPPTLAYGSRGSTGIGPDSTLIFQVELLKTNASLAAKH